VKYHEIARQWIGEEHYAANPADWVEGEVANRPPTSVIEADHSMAWTWEADLTTEETALFDTILDRAGGDSLPTEEQLDALIRTMKQYRDATAPTQAQTVVAVKALVDYVRYLTNRV
jgi:hypothetical protein